MSLRCRCSAVNNRLPLHAEVVEHKTQQARLGQQMLMHGYGRFAESSSSQDHNSSPTRLAAFLLPNPSDQLPGAVLQADWGFRALSMLLSEDAVGTRYQLTFGLGRVRRDAVSLRYNRHRRKSGGGRREGEKQVGA